MPTTALPTSDPWAGLNHKSRMEAPERSQSFSPWVPRSERRRLTAYEILDAYTSNNARTLLPPLGSDLEREKAWQEYGDAALLVSRIADGVVGEDPTVSIIGADVPLAEGPDFPAEPAKPEQGAMSPEAFRRRMEIHGRQLQIWEQQLDDAVATWEQDIVAQPALIERQDWLRKWSDEEDFIRKMVEAEKRNVVKHGSGVYVLNWDEDRKRPGIETYDPASYFPIIGDTRPSEFPDRVHLAWEITETDGRGKEKKFVRRITYELRRRDTLPEGFDEGDRPRYLPPGSDGEDPWTHVALLSDGRWEMEAFRDTTLDSIEDAAIWKQVFIDGEFVELRNYALGWDFLPVVHVTHDLAGQTHYGTPPLAALAQLLDELQAADTDEAMASRWASRPPLVFRGMAQAGGRTPEQRAANNTVNVSAGKGYFASEGGGVDVVDMAANLTALMDRVRRLLKRASVNGSVSEGLIGRVDASEVPSGFALTLSFTAFEQMIEGARLARAGAYALILKFAQRIQIHNGGGFDTFVSDGQGNTITNTSTEVYPAEVTFGAFMPQDLSGTIELVSRAVVAHTMSIQTAIKMLEEAGVPIEDIRAEFAAILSTWGELAESVTAATGDEALAAEILGFTERLDPDAEAEGNEDDETDPAGTDLAGVGADNGQAQ